MLLLTPNSNLTGLYPGETPGFFRGGYRWISGGFPWPPWLASPAGGEFFSGKALSNHTNLAKLAQNPRSRTDSKSTFFSRPSYFLCAAYIFLRHWLNGWQTNLPARSLENDDIIVAVGIRGKNQEFPPQISTTTSREDPPDGCVCSIAVRHPDPELPMPLAPPQISFTTTCAARPIPAYHRAKQHPGSLGLLLRARSPSLLYFQVAEARFAATTTHAAAV